MTELKINPKILEALEEKKISKNDAIPLLLSLYYGFEIPSYIPNRLQTLIVATGIVKPGKFNTIQWTVPLFEGVETAFAWVKDYVNLFVEANPNKVAKVADSTRRMKKLFAENPEIRKEEVMEATKMYIRNTDLQYIRDPHYFILKGSGVTKTQDILDWVEKYRDSIKVIESKSLTNKMQ